ncbi:hypothetical protein PoB_007092400 [Plakobranchus ocellatus]|uniref:Uncharacterized protein n=1 Tax=Plakobranchus ocellatus TaxID=259542 RepID=A0AAV4DJL8_9GAST|nr:hypothetical protein PoB_007092400 [Plakobranchus ocellatus]
MEHMSAGKVDNAKVETATDNPCSPTKAVTTKQELSNEDFPVCHKVTGSQSSIDHDKSDVKRSAGHRSKSFLEEPTRSKAVNFMQSNHGDSSIRSTHGSHGDGITQSNLVSKCGGRKQLLLIPVTNMLILTSPKTDGSTGDGKPVLRSAGSFLSRVRVPPLRLWTGYTQKLIQTDDSANLVRVYTSSATKAEEASKAQVGNALLSSPHAGTIVSNYLNSYRCYLAYLRNSEAFGTVGRDAVKPQHTPLSNVPLVLPLSRMTPVFSDDSHNDPEFIDLLKKTTTESIRNLWPCRNKTNIFCKTQFSQPASLEISSPEESSEIVLDEDSVSNSDRASIEQADVCAQSQGSYVTYVDKDETLCCPNSQLVDEDHGSNNLLEDLKLGMNLLAEPSDIVFQFDQASNLIDEEELTGDKSRDEMVKTVTDGVHTFSTSTSSAHSQANSAYWSEAAQDGDGDGKLSHNKASHFNKLLQLQQKLLHQQHLQRQLMQHQQRQQQQQQQQQQQHQQMQQQQQQIQPEQQLLQHFQNKVASHEGDQQQPQQPQQPQEKQQQQIQLGQMLYEKKQFSLDAKSWYPMSSETSPSCESNKASLSTGTHLTSVHTSKPDLQSSMQATIAGFDPCNKVSSQRCYPTSVNLTSLPQPGMAISCHHTTDTPTQLRTLRASYACLDPQQHNTMLSADQLFGPLGEECAIKSSKDLVGNQPFGADSFGRKCVSFSTDDNSRSWSNLNTKTLSGLSTDDVCDKIDVCKDNHWSNSVAPGVQGRLKKAYVRTMAGDFDQGGAWAGFSAGLNQQALPKNDDEALFVNELTNQTLNFHDQNPFYDEAQQNTSRRQNIGSVGSTLVYSKGHSSWPHLSEAPGTFENFDYSNDGCQGQINEVSHLQQLACLEPASRLSRLYQWRIDADEPVGPGCNLKSSESDDALIADVQADRDFSWNASSVASQLEQSEMFRAGNSVVTSGIMHSSAAVGNAPASFVDRMASLSFEKKHQAIPGGEVQGRGSAFEAFREPALNIDQSGVFLERSAPKPQQHPWNINGTQSSVGNLRATNGSSMSCGPFLTNSMQILNNKVHSVPTASVKNGRAAESGTIRCVEACSGSAMLSPRDSSKAGVTGAFSISGKTPSSGQTGTESVSQQAAAQQQQQSQQQQQQQQQQQSQQHPQQQHTSHGNQSSLFSLSDELEKTYLSDGLVSKPWHELASEDHSNNDFQMDSNSKQITGPSSLSATSPSFAASDVTKDRCSHNNTDGNLPKDQTIQTRQANTHRPRLILGANSLQTQKQRESSQVDNLEESNRRLREMLGLSPSNDQIGKPASQSPYLQDTLSGQAQHPSGLVTNSGVPGQLMTNSSMNGPGTRVQLPNSNMQSSLSLNHQMYCVPNILMPPPQAQPTTTSRTSNVVLGGVNSSSPFPGMIRLPYVDMSRVVYIQQMPVNVASSQPNNNNHNNSTSSNPHVNVSNIITINTDKDFSNSGQSDKPGRLVRQNLNKNKTTFLKVRSGSEEYAVPILGMRPSLDETACTRQIKRRTNPWDQDLDQDFNSSLLSKAKPVEQVTGLGTISNVADCVNGPAEQGKSHGVGTILGSGGGGASSAGQGGTPTGSETNMQMATFMQWPASADMHPEMLDMLPVRRAGPDDCGMGGRVCWPDMEFMLTSRDQLQNTRRSNKPMGSNKANLISIIPRGNSTDTQVGGANSVHKDLEIN